MERTPSPMKEASVPLSTTASSSQLEASDTTGSTRTPSPRGEDLGLPQLVYAFIAKTDTREVVAEYPANGNFRDLALEAIDRFSGSFCSSEASHCEEKSYAMGQHGLHFKRDEASGRWLACAAQVELGREVPMKFLEDLQARLAREAGEAVASEVAPEGSPLPRSRRERVKRWFRGRVASEPEAAPEPAFSDFQGVMKEVMESHNEEARGMDRVAMMQRKIQDINAGLMQNIQDLIDRGTAIDALVQQCDALNLEAQSFRTTTVRAVQQAQGRHKKVKCFIFVAVALFVLLVMLWMDGGVQGACSKFLRGSMNTS